MKKATNSASMRMKNEKIILSLIHKGPVSRVEIAKKTGLTKAAVTIIVDDLKRRSIITEQMGKSDTVGRNPVMLYLNGSSVYTAGVNITRRHIAVGITDLDGNIIEQDTIPVCNPDEAFLKIKEIFQNQLLSSGLDISQIYKMSVVTPGPVDVKKGIILNPPNFKEWHNVPVVKGIKGLIDIDIVFENISGATAIAEKYFGAALNTENFLTLRVDEGIGSGIVINDVLFKGPCEIGHTSIKYDGEKCECGNCGCLEKYAAIPRILENTKYKSWQEAVDNDDISVLEKEAEYLSCAIISANNVFHFDKIVLCGDLTYKPEKLTKLISDKISQNVLLKKSFDVCAGEVKSRILIASAMAVHNFFI